MRRWSPNKKLSKKPKLRLVLFPNLRLDSEKWIETHVSRNSPCGRNLGVPKFPMLSNFCNFDETLAIRDWKPSKKLSKEPHSFFRLVSEKLIETQVSWNSLYSRNVGVPKFPMWSRFCECKPNEKKTLYEAGFGNILYVLPLCALMWKMIWAEVSELIPF